MIKKLKDIFYDLNDILVALIIIAVASLVIVTNIDSILAYPSSIAEEIQVPEEEAPTHYAENPPIADPDGSDADNQGSAGTGADDQITDGQSTDGQNTSGNSGQNSTGGGVSGQPGSDGSNGSGTPDGSGSGSGDAVNVSISIPSGSTGDKIADILIGAGLVKDRQEFNQAATAAGAEGKLRAGNFVIPSNATPAEIISILTR